MSYSMSLLGNVRRSSTNIAKQFCKLDCYNNVFIEKKFNNCKCFPSCKQLNYNPDKGRYGNYHVYYNKRNCDCKHGVCSITKSNTMTTSQRYSHRSSM